MLEQTREADITEAHADTGISPIFLSSEDALSLEVVTFNQAITDIVPSDSNPFQHTAEINFEELRELFHQNGGDMSAKELFFLELNNIACSDFPPEEQFSVFTKLKQASTTKASIIKKDIINSCLRIISKMAMGFFPPRNPNYLDLVQETCTFLLERGIDNFDHTRNVPFHHYIRRYMQNAFRSMSRINIPVSFPHNQAHNLRKVEKYLRGPLTAENIHFIIGLPIIERETPLTREMAEGLLLFKNAKYSSLDQYRGTNRPLSQIIYSSQTNDSSDPQQLQETLFELFDFYSEVPKSYLVNAPDTVEELSTVMEELILSLYKPHPQQNHKRDSLIFLYALGLADGVSYSFEDVAALDVWGEQNFTRQTAHNAFGRIMTKVHNIPQMAYMLKGFIRSQFSKGRVNEGILEGIENKFR